MESVIEIDLVTQHQIIGKVVYILHYANTFE